MADRRVDVLLVGGGVASTECASTLRDEGFDGSILLCGRELDAPYERPPVSKGYLLGKVEKPRLALRPEGWWGERDVELATRTGVMKLDLEARVARLMTKQEVEFDRLLLATGAQVRRLPVDGAQLDGIEYVRAPGNADAIRRGLDAAARPEVVVVGGSYLGTEVAAAMVELGRPVTVLLQEDAPLERHYGATAGRWFQALLEERGVRFVTGSSLGAFEPSADDPERVGAVRTDGGDELPAGLVVVAAGAVPDVMLAKAAGLPIGDRGGVACDPALRVHRADRVWAAGDMCEWDSPLHGGPARVEHWNVAAAHGRTAARSMLGQDVVHDEVPSFWSDLSDWATSEYVGGLGPWDREVVRGSLDDGAFSVWQLESDGEGASSPGGRVVGVLCVGRRADLRAGRELLAGRARLDAERLATVDDAREAAV